MKMREYGSRVGEYAAYLRQEERCEATVLQYRREVDCFLEYCGDMEAHKETVIEYKEYLKERYRAATVNGKLAAVNGFLAFVGLLTCRVRQLRIQRQAYCPKEKELSRDEYRRLVEAARRKNNEKLALILETICSTGIRVSELRFITVEAAQRGQAAIRLKGKSRTVLLPTKLRRVLVSYIRGHNLTSGPVFLSRSGKPIDRTSVWRAMKALCVDAGVEPDKVFPHNLRHLFARCFYSIDKDIARLADILGHSSINTTRIYIISSGEEHLRRMDEMELVV